MDLFPSYKSPPLVTVCKLLERFLNKELAMPLDCPPVCEVVSSFVVFIVLQLSGKVNIKFEIFENNFKLSKK